MYYDTFMRKTAETNKSIDLKLSTKADPPLIVERVQTGVKIEKRILKVLKGLAEYHDLSLGDLLEGILLHTFEGKNPFGEQSLAVIAELKRIYKLDLAAADSHHLLETETIKSVAKRKSVKAKK